MDTDHVAHALLESGTPVFEAVVSHFGKNYLNTQGDLDRKKLGECVFADAEARKYLNALMHPEIKKRLRTWLAEQQGPMAVVAVPLLFEVGLESAFDEILCVWAPESLMIQRLQTRNLTEKEAILRIRSQMPVDLKAAKSTWTLKNNRTLDDLHQQVDAWVNHMIPQEKN